MKKLLLLFVMLAFGLASFAQISSTQTGNWNDPTTWQGGIIPGNNDVVIIVSGTTVTVAADASAKSITVNNGGNLQINTGGKLSTVPPTVTSPETGKIWMDRNLGASRVATAKNDTEAYGDYYQWGRLTDGHENKNSETTPTLSDTDVPGHEDFITINDGNVDWRNPKNDNLWQGLNGINNPCPAGFRLPTEQEWSAEVADWAPQNADGAFGSFLKLPMCGFRVSDNTYVSTGTEGYYWSSTPYATKAKALSVYSNDIDFAFEDRASGQSVRCIKD